PLIPEDRKTPMTSVYPSSRNCSYFVINSPIAGWLVVGIVLDVFILSYNSYAEIDAFFSKFSMLSKVILSVVIFILFFNVRALSWVISTNLFEIIFTLR